MLLKTLSENKNKIRTMLPKGKEKPGLLGCSFSISSFFSPPTTKPGYFNGNFFLPKFVENKHVND